MNNILKGKFLMDEDLRKKREELLQWSRMVMIVTTLLALGGGAAATQYPSVWWFVPAGLVGACWIGASVWLGLRIVWRHKRGQLLWVLAVVTVALLYPLFYKP